MAKQGQATQALTLAFLSAGFGALVGVILITVLSTWVAKFALRFSSPEYFAVYFLAFASFIGLGAASPFKTVVSMGLGFAFAAVGMDTMSGRPAPDLWLQRASVRHQLPHRGDRPVRHRRADAHHGGGACASTASARASRSRDVLKTIATMPRYWVTLLRSSIIGCWMGITPGGPTAASFMSYGIRQAPLPPQGRLSARASPRASSRPRPRITPPEAAPSCRCWPSAFPAPRPRP